MSYSINLSLSPKSSNSAGWEENQLVDINYSSDSIFVEAKQDFSTPGIKYCVTLPIHSTITIKATGFCTTGNAFLWAYVTDTKLRLTENYTFLPTELGEACTTFMIPYQDSICTAYVGVLFTNPSYNPQSGLIDSFVLKSMTVSVGDNCNDDGGGGGGGGGNGGGNGGCGGNNANCNTTSTCDNGCTVINNNINISKSAITGGILGTCPEDDDAEVDYDNVSEYTDILNSNSSKQNIVLPDINECISDMNEIVEFKNKFVEANEDEEYTTKLLNDCKNTVLEELQQYKYTYLDKNIEESSNYQNPLQTNSILNELNDNSLKTLGMDLLSYALSPSTTSSTTHDSTANQNTLCSIIPKEQSKSDFTYNGNIDNFNSFVDNLLEKS